MRLVTYAAPAKIILSGEHAVVYGKPALLLGIGYHCAVTVSAAKRLDAPLPPHEQIVLDVVRNALKKEKHPLSSEPVSLSVENAIPIGRGLGSSAAFSAAAVGALLHWYTGKEPSKDRINSLAYIAEKHFHGNPSGADNTASCYGGLIYYRKEFEFLKTISALNAKLPAVFENRLLLIDTGRPEESTAKMVQSVAQRYNSDPQGSDRLLSKIEKCTKRLVVSVVTEDAELFGKCIQENQEHLQALGVVSKAASAMLTQLAGYGVGKVTGAGGKASGGGYLLFYCTDRAATEAYLRSHSLPFLPVVQDIHGVHCRQSV